MIWNLLLSGLTMFVKPLFEFLNKRTESNLQMHIVDVKTMGEIAGAGLSGLSKADELVADIRKKEGNWGPTVVMMLIILAPFVWHEWQVVLDSSRFIPSIAYAWDWFPYVTVIEHRPGSWGVPSIGKPGADGQSAWDKTQQAIFTSFFIGATTAIATVAAIKAIRK